MNLREVLQAGPAKANDLFAQLFATSGGQLKTREKLFGELKSELELYAELEQRHLFPVLRKHQETKDLFPAVSQDNKELKARLADLEALPKDAEDFIQKLQDLAKGFQRYVRDEKKEILPAVMRAVSEAEAQTVAGNIEAGREDAEQAARDQIEKQKADARREREQAAQQAVKAAEQAKKAAEQKAAEQAEKVAEQKAAEQAKKAAEQKAAAQVKKAAEQKAAEQAKKLAEQKAAEQAKKAAEQKAAAQAKKAAEQKAAEQAKKAAEQKAAAQAKKAAEKKAAERAQKAAERKAAEQKAAARAEKAAEKKAAEKAQKADELKAAEKSRKADELKAAEKARKAAAPQGRDATSLAAFSKTATGGMTEIGSAWMDWLGGSTSAGTDLSQRLLRCRTVQDLVQTQYSFLAGSAQSWMEHNARVLQVSRRVADEALRSLTHRSGPQE